MAATATRARPRPPRRAGTGPLGLPASGLGSPFVTISSSALPVFANDAQTTVTSGGTQPLQAGVPETWTVASSATFPAASSSASPPALFHVADIAYPSELIAVTNVSGTTWSVIRGAESTVPVGHLAGFTIQQAVTAGDLGALSAAPATARVNLGLTWKDPVQQATIAALPSNTYFSGVLTAAANGALTVDSVACVTGQRILVTDEAAAANNGIYVVTSPGSAGTPYVLTRSADMATGSQVTGAMVMVEQGTVAAGSGWFVEGAGPDTIGTTGIYWTKVTAIISGNNPQPLGTAAPGTTGQVSDSGHIHAWGQAAPAGFTPSNPTATASTTLVMMGLGSTCAYTPAGSGIVLVNVSGYVQTLTAVTTVTFGGRYGTGTAPANGAAVTGTRFGAAGDPSAGPPAVGRPAAIALTALLTLTPATAYWFDLALLTGNASDSAELTNVSMTFAELP
jgi:hypothetical protein